MKLVTVKSILIMMTDTNDKNTENKGNINQVGGGIDDHSGCGSMVRMITI